MSKGHRWIALVVGVGTALSLASSVLARIDQPNSERWTGLGVGILCVLFAIPFAAAAVSAILPRVSPRRGDGQESDK